MRIVIVRVIVDGVLGVIGVLIGHDEVLVIYVAIFVVIFCSWRCTLYTVDVVFIEAWPDARAKLLGLGQACYVSGGGVFQCATSSDASIGNSNAGWPPVLVEHSTTRE